MVPTSLTQDVVSASPDEPPPPLEIDKAGDGLSVGEIADRNGHSLVAVYKAAKRLKVCHLTFKRIRLYSQAQADFLRDSMRKSDNRSGKRGAPSASCPQN